MSYATDAEYDAKETIDNFREEIIDQLVDNGTASDDLFNDYSGGDSYHHETHVDKEYNLQEAAELLDDLRDDEETDSGLWQGLPPRDAIGAQAAYTYGNAVLREWRDLIDDINGQAADIIDSHGRLEIEAEGQRERLDELQDADSDDSDDLDEDEQSELQNLLETEDDFCEDRLKEILRENLDEMINGVVA